MMKFIGWHLRQPVGTGPRVELAGFWWLVSSDRHELEAGQLVQARMDRVHESRANRRAEQEGKK